MILRLSQTLLEQLPLTTLLTVILGNYFIHCLGWSKFKMISTEKDPNLRNLISKRFMSTASSPMHHTFSGDFGIQQWGAPEL